MSIEGLVSSLVFPFKNCKCVPSGSPDNLTTIMYIAQINKCIHVSDWMPLQLDSATNTRALPAM